MSNRPTSYADDVVERGQCSKRRCLPHGERRWYHERAELSLRCGGLASSEPQPRPAPEGRKGMKKDIADEFERELMQPLAKALRTRLGDGGGCPGQQRAAPDR